LYTTVVAEYRYATNTSNGPKLIVPNELELETPQEYIKHLTRERSENKLKLKMVVIGCRALQDRIKNAAELGEIPPKL
jgi:hypothetical protein